MMRWLILLRLKVRAWLLYEQAVHAEGLISDHTRRYQVLLLELRKVKGRIACLEKPDVLLRQALRKV